MLVYLGARRARSIRRGVQPWCDVIAYMQGDGAEEVDCDTCALRVPEGHVYAEGTPRTHTSSNVRYNFDIQICKSSTWVCSGYLLVPARECTNDKRAYVLCCRMHLCRLQWQ